MANEHLVRIAAQKILDDRADAFNRVLRERDEARTEIEALTASAKKAERSLDNCWRRYEIVAKDACSESIKYLGAKRALAAALAENERLRAALECFASEINWRLGGPFDPDSPSFTGIGMASAALKGGNADG